MGFVKAVQKGMAEKRIEKESGEFYSKLLHDGEKVLDVFKDAKYDFSYTDTNSPKSGDVIITDQRIIFTGKRVDLDNLKKGDVYSEISLNLDAAKESVREVSRHNKIALKEVENGNLKSFIKGRGYMENYTAFKDRVGVFGSVDKKGIFGGKIKITFYLLQDMYSIEIKNHLQNLKSWEEELSKTNSKDLDKYQSLIRKTEKVYSDPKYFDKFLKWMNPARVNVLIEKLDGNSDEIFNVLSRIDSSQLKEFIYDKGAVEKTYMESRMPVELRK
ncbi:hypothetical protein Mia14_0387 [Candidatus Mancarchaeum acidiphilum]|uniref:Uncharacterized protein n=1 Tax=Candidatus Mancarchaeum acidiphilum TaxID=1920749 RepID=A0A218NMK3_9ARCH|nr:hypothetical protein [Candidatus Mancarchaeum acidiphilum]ASI13709.1 hypothetical protein Mia14_0387 [Candidatus Mancarchaeum acidiphilum]